MRKRIFEIVHIYDYDIVSRVYKYFMIFFIILSLIPLTFKESSPILRVTELLCLLTFIADYILRWITADYKLGISGKSAFLKFPIRIISVIDILSVFALLCSAFGWFEEQSVAAEVLTVFRVIRIFRYSKNVRTILEIFERSKKALIAVINLAIGYIVISAIIIFNVEPQSFDTFFEALYWATVSLTTVGYGDIYPVTAMGRFVAMASSFFGIAIVALPAGIVTAEYLKTIKNDGE